MQKNTFSRILICVSLLTGLTAFAQTAPPASSSKTPTRDSDKLDIKQLEDRYWTSKDDDYTVVQNRTYTKAKRFFLSAQYGPLINDSYSEGNMNSFSLGYFFSEKWGLEYSHTGSSLKDNETTSYFRSRFGASPDYNVLSSTDTLSAVFVPFYAKMSVLEKRILYFDMAFSLGVGQTSYASQTSGGGVDAKTQHIELNVIQQVFITNNFAIRFDIRNQWSKQKRYQYNIPVGQTEPSTISDANIQNTMMILGLTYFH